MLLSPRPTPLEGFTLLLSDLILIEPMSQIPLTFLGYPVTIKIAKPETWPYHFRAGLAPALTATSNVAPRKLADRLKEAVHTITRGIP